MTTVYLCTGKDCRRSPGHEELAGGLAGDLVVEVRCQKICKGPVAGLEVEGRIEWFRSLRKPKARRALGRLVAAGGDGPLPERLARRRVSKRSGLLRR